jgi:hypothetical protein
MTNINQAKIEAAQRRNSRLQGIRRGPELIPKQPKLTGLAAARRNAQKHIAPKSGKR